MVKTYEVWVEENMDRLSEKFEKHCHERASEGLMYSSSDEAFWQFTYEVYEKEIGDENPNPS